MERKKKIWEGREEVVRKAREKGEPSKDALSYFELWWLHGKPRPELRPALQGLTRYIATVETSKHRTFQFLDAEILPDNMLVAIASDDPFHLGVLSSRAHVRWSLRAGGTLEDRPRYTKGAIFDTFPFPDPTSLKRTQIAELAETLDVARKEALAEVSRLTMTEIYNWRERIAAGEQLTGNDLDRATAARAFIIHHLHEKIDAAVADAYGWPSDLAPAELVARLVALNRERKAEELNGFVRWLRSEYQESKMGKKETSRE